MSFLPSADRRYLQEREITFREITDGAQKGVILPAFALPADKYQVGQAEILILIPGGYPDVAPDMFHALPMAPVRARQSLPEGSRPARSVRQSPMAALVSPQP